MTEAPVAPPAPDEPEAVVPASAPILAGSPAPAAAQPNKMMPWLIAAAVVLVAAAGVFVYMNFFSTMSAADYRAKAVQYIDEVQATSDAFNEAGSGLDSTDPATRAAGKTAWEAAAQKMKDAMAKVRSLRPPSELQAVHARILKGMDSYDKLLTVTGALVNKVADGSVTGENIATSPEGQALSALQQDGTLAEAFTDYQAAYEELKVAK